MLFEKNEKYYSYDENFKVIAQEWKSSLGWFRSIAGNFVNFNKNSKVYTRDRFFKETGNRWE